MPACYLQIYKGAGSKTNLPQPTFSNYVMAFHYYGQTRDPHKVIVSSFEEVGNPGSIHDSPGSGKVRALLKSSHGRVHAVFRIIHFTLPLNVQALTVWTNQTEAWDVPMFFGEFGANTDKNLDNADFQVSLSPLDTVETLFHAIIGHNHHSFQSTFLPFPHKMKLADAHMHPLPEPGQKVLLISAATSKRSCLWAWLAETSVDTEQRAHD